MGISILALETATQACSVALLVNGDCATRYTEQPRQHAQLLLPMIDEVLAEGEISLQQVDYFAFSRGPGSFTGLRIGCSVVQGLAFATETAVIPISSLQALAQGAHRHSGAQHILAGLDARMQEIYWGAFQAEEHIMQAIQTEQVSAPETIMPPEAHNPWHAYGNGWQAYQQQLTPSANLQLHDTPCYPHAQDVAVLAQQQLDKAVCAAQAVPVYIRDNVVN